MSAAEVYTELVDTSIDYCTPDDVFTYIRNKQYDDLPQDPSSTSGGTLTKDQVDRLISQASEWADNTTKRAWRTRRAVDVEKRVKLSHKQKRPRHRRRRLRGRARRENYGVDPRGFVNLPHNHVKAIDSGQNDEVIVLNPRSTDDITSEEGRENGDFVISNREGVLRPEYTLFTAVGTAVHGPVIENPRVRVSYRYGEPHDVTDYDSNADGVSDTVPDDVRDAVALRVAAKIVGSDQYGEITPAGADDSPSLSDAVSSWNTEAKDLLSNHVHVVV